ncbi:SDR family oxidoreductase [Streptomyces phaeochromogenes]
MILLGSSTIHQGADRMGVYAASKAAVRSLGRTWAAELAPRGVRVEVPLAAPAGELDGTAKSDARAGRAVRGPGCSAARIARDSGLHLDAVPTWRGQVRRRRARPGVHGSIRPTKVAPYRR